MSKAMNRIVFLAWEKHRRCVTLSSKLGAKGIFIECNLPRIVKYPLLIFRTIGILIGNKPKILFIQNPSIVLACIATIVRPIVRFCLVIDAHNVGVMWYGRGRSFFELVLRLLHKFANLTIVSNDVLANKVKRNGGVAAVLPDPLPQPKVTRSLRGENRNRVFRVVFVCTFSEDEPYRAVFASSKLLPEDVIIYVTGNPPRKRHREELPKRPNLVFTGFVPEYQYWELLANCDCLIDLTTRENCLVCGAYEGISLGIPMVLSDTYVTREYFSKGAIYVKPDASDIATAILKIREDHDKFKRLALELQSELNAKWLKCYHNLMNIVLEICS